MSEFDLIASYFTWDNSFSSSSINNSSDINSNCLDLKQSSSNTTKANQQSRIIKSVGDDAAVLSLAVNKQLVTSIDTLVSGVHFPKNTSAFDVGYKALAVNLSDLAAMGAKPEWFTLALTLPEIDHDWLSEFSRGLKTLAQAANIALVGGDTTSGSLTISIQVMGSVDNGHALYRSGANTGDKIYITGTLGDGAAGLASIKNELLLTTVNAEYCQQRLNRPTPRLNESELIKPFASSCIDVSDGFLQDLSHILSQSNAVNFEKPDVKNTLGAQLDLSEIPLSNALKSIEPTKALAFALTGGDDYEILFTIPESLDEQFLEISEASPYQFSCIGSIKDKAGVVDTQNNALTPTGYDHFL